MSAQLDIKSLFVAFDMPLEKRLSRYVGCFINILSVVAMQHDSLILFLNNPVPLILPEERWVVAVLPAHDLAALLFVSVQPLSTAFLMLFP